MNIFQKERVYIQRDMHGVVRTVRLDANGDGYYSNDLWELGHEQGDTLTDSEVAELYRTIELGGARPIVQKV